MIAGFAKEFGMTLDEVLYEISYSNLTLYSASLPHYDDIEDEWDDSIDACNPNNIHDDDDDEEYVR